MIERGERGRDRKREEEERGGRERRKREEEERRGRETRKRKEEGRG